MRKIIFIFILLTLINFTSAETGCCVDYDNGACNVNSERTSCENFGGTFYNDASCGSVSSCNAGCCLIGLSTSYTTSAQCQIQASSKGVDYDFQTVSEEACAEIAANQETGACVYENDAGNKCSFVKKDECGGTFYSGALCSDPSLNTICKKTDQTLCYQDDVYFVDSCGNIDAQYKDCNYDKGTICGAYRSGIDTKPSSGNYVCRSLNCKDPKTKLVIPNGARWCVDPTGKGGIGILTMEDLTGEGEEESKTTGKAIFGLDSNKKVIRNGVEGTISKSGLFLRDEKYANRNLITGRFTDEECAERAAESAEGEEEELILCISATMPNEDGEVEEDKVVYDPYTCEVCDQSLDACGENLCERCKNDLGGESWPGRLNGCVSDNACAAEGEEVPVGSRFYSQYCLNGDVITEPCDDFRQGYCDNEQTKGQCAYNPSLECSLGTPLENDDEESEIDPELCSEEFCSIYSPGEENEIFADLGLEMCLPKIAPGFIFYPTEDQFEEGSVNNQEEMNECSPGNWEGEVTFVRGGEDNKNWALLKESDEKYDSLAIVDTCADDWFQPSNRDYLLAGIEGNPYTNDLKFVDRAGYILERVGIIEKIYNGELSAEEFINPALIGALQQRCRSLGDCDGKVNWVGVEGSSEADYLIDDSKSQQSTPDGGRTSLSISLSFDCSLWSAPSGGEACKICGLDGLPCSEYRCKALGKGCNYYEPDGTNKGYCIPSSDTIPPTVKCSNCPGRVPPFSAAEFTVVTNEIAQCKFNIGEAGASYEDMPYDFGEVYGIEHKMYLHLPGQSAFENQNVSSYDLIDEDGKYTVYTRCEDIAGNSNVNAYTFSFIVDPDPDTVPTNILSYSPENGAPVKYNTTTQNVQFKISEPSDCKWSTSDKDYDQMENSFKCDNAVSDSGLVNGYYCSGTLAGVTLNSNNQSTYYIRCEDQPWLEGAETDIYQRNKNDKSFVYKLKPSKELKIASLTPEGEIIVNPTETSVNIQVQTVGGGYSSNAVCYFKLNNYPSYIRMLNTNSNVHSQPLVNQSEGSYTLDVRCEDKSGNIAEKTNSFSIKKDTGYPEITRVYSFQGNMVVVTNEEAKCYYSIDTCAFNIEEATEMSGDELEHKTEFEGQLIHYVKCEDVFGNSPGQCQIKVREFRDYDF